MYCEAPTREVHDYREINKLKFDNILHISYDF